jgi:hypothetical protein
MTMMNSDYKDRGHQVAQEGQAGCVIIRMHIPAAKGKTVMIRCGGVPPYGLVEAQVTS